MALESRKAAARRGAAVSSDEASRMVVW
jgi:hypothetical protein